MDFEPVGRNRKGKKDKVRLWRTECKKTAQKIVAVAMKGKPHNQSNLGNNSHQNIQ